MNSAMGKGEIDEKEVQTLLAWCMVGYWQLWIWCVGSVLADPTLIPASSMWQIDSEEHSFIGF